MPPPPKSVRHWNDTGRCAADLAGCSSPIAFRQLARDFSLCVKVELLDLARHHGLSRWTPGLEGVVRLRDERQATALRVIFPCAWGAFACTTPPRWAIMGGVVPPP